ncbi:Rv3235 family protein [Corynebacterium halotolerans]|uniref:Uncharacterized protein n=1 Tax=Corynebacterium halotolerans YIM 70093 = DSM 44683 TaxID=1121362 RepID=M1P516_9CORY|nr:Rv3235 family protein [Corynebacterium halotolerans]AGF71761.1 hypothetical protein A605_03750 [Corynebacterium halotolerans YIM 70093 = DSM 44683]
MLTPVPGCTHLKVLVPDPSPASTPSPQPTRDTRRTAAHLVLIALEVTFGLRPAHQLTPRRFDAAVRIHVTARLRATRGAQEIRGPVRLDSLHTRPDGEVFGTAVTGTRTHAFTARIDDTRMRSFRVL